MLEELDVCSVFQILLKFDFFTIVGIKYDIHQNKLGNDVFQEGLHVGTPGYEFIKFPKVFKTITFNKLKCLNKDGLTITLSVQFQYKVNEKRIKSLILQFQNHARYVQVLRCAWFYFKLSTVLAFFSSLLCFSFLVSSLLFSFLVSSFLFSHSLFLFLLFFIVLTLAYDLSSRTFLCKYLGFLIYSKENLCFKQGDIPRECYFFFDVFSWLKCV